MARRWPPVCTGIFSLQFSLSVAGEKNIMQIAAAASESALKPKKR